MFSVRVNVVGYDETTPSDPYYPVAISKSTNTDHLTVNVLLIGNETTTHFILIKSLNALLRKANTRTVKHYCVRFVFEDNIYIYIFFFSMKAQ